MCRHALIAAGVEPINRSEHITDNILGTRIHGTRTRRARSASRPSRRPIAPCWNSFPRAHSRSQNVGNNGPAVIRSTAHTNFTATKRVELSDPGFAAQPANANATTNSDIHSIAKRGGGLGSRIVSRVGWQRANQSHGRADAIASDHAEDRIERRFNQEVNDELRDARKRYEDEYRRPLIRRGELPEYTRFSSDNDSISIETTQANRGQLGAAGPPPAAPEGHDMTMRLHESAVNNYTAGLLGGATATRIATRRRDQVRRRAAGMDPRCLGAERKGIRGGHCRGRGAVQALVHDIARAADHRRLSGRKIDAHHARRAARNPATKPSTIGTSPARIRRKLENGGVVLRREGDLVVLPGDFRGSLTSRQTAERSNLEKEINERSARGRGFPSTIELDPLEPEGPLADAGPLAFNEFVTDDDWLTMAWDRQSKRVIENN